jgi:hypothetical protein
MGKRASRHLAELSAIRIRGRSALTPSSRETGISVTSPVYQPIIPGTYRNRTLRALRFLSSDRTMDSIDLGSKVMEQETDWRYDNAKKHDGAVVSWCLYKSPRADWDHDHCIGCWRKFAEASDPPEILDAGYKTEDDEWVCPECFSDLRDQLHWTVVGDARRSP